MQGPELPRRAYSEKLQGASSSCEILGLSLKMGPLVVKDAVLADYTTVSCRDGPEHGDFRRTLVLPSLVSMSGSSLSMSLQV